MDFPTRHSADRDDPKPSAGAIGITAPEDDDTKSAEERFIDQQWRDVAASDVIKDHPLSLNRDSEYVTTDPYKTS